MAPILLNLLPFAALAILLVGLVIIVRGFRGKPEWSAPTCAKCKYCLRQLDAETTESCPECGSNLRSPHAVRFGRYRRSKKMIIGGAVIALLPVLLIGGVFAQRAM